MRQRFLDVSDGCNGSLSLYLMSCRMRRLHRAVRGSSDGSCPVITGQLPPRGARPSSSTVANSSRHRKVSGQRRPRTRATLIHLRPRANGCFPILTGRSIIAAINGNGCGSTTAGVAPLRRSLPPSPTSSPCAEATQTRCISACASCICVPCMCASHPS